MAPLDRVERLLQADSPGSTAHNGMARAKGVGPARTPAYSPITAQRKPIMMKNPENMAISPIPP